MPFVILMIGIILVVVAYQGTHTQLLTALKQDLPGFFKWALAISAIMALGYVPGMQKPSRYLLGLVLLVIFLTNYTNILNGFTSLAGTGQASTDAGSTSPAATNPTATYSQSFAPGAAAAAGETGTTGGSATTVAVAANGAPSVGLSLHYSDPNTYVAAYVSPSSLGFGGVA